MGDGTCWRNPVQATEMWRVTLKVKGQADWSDAQKHAHSQPHDHEQLELLLRGNFRASTHCESHVKCLNHQACKHILTHCLTALWLDLIRQWVETLFYRVTDSSGEDGGILLVSNCVQRSESTWWGKKKKKTLQGEPGAPCVGNKLLYRVKTNPYWSRASVSWVCKTNSGKTKFHFFCTH